MKIKVTRDDEEPIGCNSCKEDLNAYNHVEIELKNDLSVHVWLCDSCLKKVQE